METNQKTVIKDKTKGGCRNFDELATRFIDFNEMELYKMLTILCIQVSYYGSPITGSNIHSAADQIEADRKYNESMNGSG